MAKKTKKPRKQKQEKPLRWRETLMRHWREHLRLTLEGVADALAKPPYRLKTTHASLGRVENGRQMPKIDLIEALARIYGTDIHSMLNGLPTIPSGRSRPDARELAQLWDAASSEDQEKIISIVKITIAGKGPKPT